MKWENKHLNVSFCNKKLSGVRLYSAYPLGNKNDVNKWIITYNYDALLSETIIISILMQFTLLLVRISTKF